jgi:general secretion pathway protein F
MGQFRYRAITPAGTTRQGTIDATDRSNAIAAIRREGAMVVELIPATARSSEKAGSAVSSAATAAFIAESAVLLRAGLPLDRALSLAVENIEPRKLAPRFAPVLALVREGKPLSLAFAQNPDLFSPTAVAMCEAGEANGRLPDALDRLAAMMEQSAELRKMVVQSSIYPIALLVIAVGVILLMLLFVVPQFESVIGKDLAKLPASSRLVITASLVLREQGLVMLLALGAGIVAMRQMLRQPTARLAFARGILNTPGIGPIVQRLEFARLSRTLGALIDGEVALPHAMGLSQRTISNPVIASGLGGATAMVREGAGLSTALAQNLTMPHIVAGFVRTGEESSELGPMLLRLADVLDRDVRARIQALVAILTPVITVVLGASVAGIVASIMSAIMGFNSLALSQ